MGARTNDEAGADDRGAAAPLTEGAVPAAGSAGATASAAEAEVNAGAAPERRVHGRTGRNADEQDAGQDAGEPAAAPEPGAEDRPFRAADRMTAPQPGADGHTAGNADGRAATEPAATTAADGRDATEPALAPHAEGRTRPHHKRTAPDVGAAVAAALAEAVHPRPVRPDAGDGGGAEARAADAGHTPDASPDHRTEQPAAPGKASSRRPPSLTRDTARPEGGGRAAPVGAPAPARQWPLLTVLALTGLGLVIVGTHAFADAFRVGTILIGVALLTGAVLRRMLPSVGMLAVRSRFTDMVTYGVLGTVIVLLALVTQPKPWLDVPFLEDAVHFTVR
ncbi:DUF3017 domain-containing protein [Streptomyces sp. NPDC000880]